MEDKIIKFLAYDGKISVTCANTTNLVEKARKIHDLSPTATAAFGRALTISAIIANQMKSQKDKMTVQIKGNGPIGTIVVTSNNFPILKGYVGNPNIDVPLNEFGKIDVKKAVGDNGYINIVKDIGLKTPYIGISPIVSGEIAEDFANYFVTSEQTNSAVGLGVLVDKNGVKASGGYLITPMPDATTDEIEKIEKSIFEAGAISKMLDQKLSLREIAIKITGDKNIKILQDDITPQYICDCSKEHMKDGLKTLSLDDIENIIEEDGKAETVCRFCNKKYEFNKEELENIAEEIKQNKNTQQM